MAELYGYLNVVQERLDEIGQEIIEQMAQIIKNNRASASGNLINSLKYDIVFQDNKFQMVIEYADYGYFVNSGRRPSMIGKFPPLQDIKNWMRIKGIPEQALWPIMMKIKKGGFYSRKTQTVVRPDGTQQTFYSQPRGINFTSPFEKNLDLKKITAEFEDLIVAEIPKDLLKGLGFEKK